MGFSLENFFAELKEIIESDGDVNTKLSELETAIQWNFDYAKQCGHLPNDGENHDYL